MEALSFARRGMAVVQQGKTQKLSKRSIYHEKQFDTIKTIETSLGPSPKYALFMSIPR
jgi:hypothetical protein